MAEKAGCVLSVRKDAHCPPLQTFWVWRLCSGNAGEVELLSQGTGTPSTPQDLGEAYRKKLAWVLQLESGAITRPGCNLSPQVPCCPNGVTATTSGAL